DLESRNGTFVDGVPVKEQVLEHGSRIQIGDLQFLCLLEDEETPQATSRVQLDDSTLIVEATVQLRDEDALYLQREIVLETLPPMARTVRELNALLRISRAISSIRGREALERRLLELIFEVIPAERGAIALLENDREEFSSVFAMHKLTAEGKPVQVSRTVVRQVIREGAAVLNNDILETKNYSAAESLMAAQTQSLLCVPLVLLDKVMGVIYLDTTNGRARFDQDHLQLVTAIASFASGALENTQRLEWLERENRPLQAEVTIQHNMVGESAGMREVYEFIAKV